jgi:hypothetical protein
MTAIDDDEGRRERRGRESLTVGVVCHRTSYSRDVKLPATKVPRIDFRKPWRLDITVTGRAVVIHSITESIGNL